MLNTFRALVVALVSAGLLTVGLTAPAEADVIVSTVATHATDKSPADLAFDPGARKPGRPGSVSQGVDFHWWGIDHNFGPVGTNKIVSILNIGGGISGIVAALCAGTIVGMPCAYAYGVAAGLAAIGAGVIGWCARNGNGFRFVKPYIGMPYCAAR